MNFYKRLLVAFSLVFVVIGCGVASQTGSTRENVRRYVPPYDGNNGGPNIPNSNSNNGGPSDNQNPQPLPIATPTLAR